MKTLILAAGPGSRWKNHAGVRKHLVEIDGKPLLHRTVEQFAQLGAVEIIARPGDDGYEHPAADTHRARLDPNNYEADRFCSSYHRWTDDTLILAYGDVWFSDETVERIAAADGWVWAARLGPSRFSGRRYGEGFAFKLPVSEHERFREKVAEAIRRRQQLPPLRGWVVWQLMEGVDPVRKVSRLKLPHHLNVDDWTEDFDRPDEYEKWVERRAAWMSSISSARSHPNSATRSAASST